MKRILPVAHREIAQVIVQHAMVILQPVHIPPWRTIQVGAMTFMMYIVTPCWAMTATFAIHQAEEILYFLTHQTAAPVLLRSAVSDATDGPKAPVALPVPACVSTTGRTTSPLAGQPVVIQMIPILEDS